MARPLGLLLRNPLRDLRVAYHEITVMHDPSQSVHGRASATLRQSSIRVIVVAESDPKTRRISLWCIVSRFVAMSAESLASPHPGSAANSIRH